MTKIQVQPEHLLKVAAQFRQGQEQLDQLLSRLGQTLSSLLMGFEGMTGERFRYEYRDAEQRMRMILSVIGSTAKQLEWIVQLFTEADSGVIDLPDSTREAWQRLTHRFEETWEPVTTAVGREWERLREKVQLELAAEREEMKIATAELDDALTYYNEARTNLDKHPDFFLHSHTLMEKYQYGVSEEEFGTRKYWQSRGYDANQLLQAAYDLRNPDGEAQYLMGKNFKQEVKANSQNTIFAVTAGATMVGARNAIASGFFRPNPGFGLRSPSSVGRYGRVNVPKPWAESKGKGKGKGNVKFSPNNLPKDPQELIKNGWEDVTPKGMAKNTASREFIDPETGMKVRFDPGKPGANGFEGKDHYHVTNPNGTTKADYYLDANGNPVAKGSKASHIVP
ncbi:WXG100 family type VII secretion target [Paenibacillus sp. JX-17]|uniref:WXG100 family type VII secretion target n=1 Tax=Paenibacillus lacisoli TaxID=3064525 RepID=A0ABT9CG94_9BACL|nr:WXG100 family type VII secretion target [Paenibacillus sp. JX-17]MDO7907659.1 WXG100 family type VII secretion target [Paenibacillus sp. JX-17]